MKVVSKSSDSNTEPEYPRQYSRWQDKKTKEQVYVCLVSPLDHLLILRPVGSKDTVLCGIRAFYRNYKPDPEQLELPLCGLV
jgi:hypothetical protein